MSLRVRLGLAAGIAVAIAVLAVSVSAYEGTRSQLRDQLDDTLESVSQPWLARAAANGGIQSQAHGRVRASPAEPEAGAGQGLTGDEGGATIGGFESAGDCDAGFGLDRAPRNQFGEARGYVQLVRTSGQICLAPGESTTIATSSTILRVAHSGRGRAFFDAHAGKADLRVLASGIGWRGALLVALPLSEIDGTLDAEVALLLAIAAGGILLAGVLGVLVARTALAPIRHFTAHAEAIAHQPKRIEEDRVEVSGNDELARLGHTFNDTLDALAASVAAQRNLVADASHELRTPIASIKANLQLMRDEELLSPSDRDALRTDVIDELDELTALVADIVELARGSKRESEPGEVRLDEIVAHAVARARRRAPQISFDARLEPTLVRGDGERIARAASNLLDNAAKWSPEREVVEVTLTDGVVVVRDHGPGFKPEDLPLVFERFHRADEARSKPGSGLGLAIVRQAAEAHGGWVEATNAPDGGALLRLSFGPTLPLVPEETTAEARA